MAFRFVGIIWIIIRPHSSLEAFIFRILSWLGVIYLSKIRCLMTAIKCRLAAIVTLVACFFLSSSMPIDSCRCLCYYKGCICQTLSTVGKFMFTTVIDVGFHSMIKLRITIWSRGRWYIYHGVTVMVPVPISFSGFEDIGMPTMLRTSITSNVRIRRSSLNFSCCFCKDRRKILYTNGNVKLVNVVALKKISWTQFIFAKFVMNEWKTLCQCRCTVFSFYD